MLEVLHFWCAFVQGLFWVDKRSPSALLICLLTFQEDPLYCSQNALSGVDPMLPSSPKFWILFLLQNVHESESGTLRTAEFVLGSIEIFVGTSFVKAGNLL